MRSLRRRGGLALAVTLAAAVVGMSTGFLLARTIAQRVAESRLVDQATRSLVAADVYGDDVRKALAAMNHSPFPYCSDQELTYFRHILFQSRFLREGGRISDGRIDCSTTMGREELPKEHYNPVFAGEDGFRVYWDLAPFRSGGEATTVSQTGSSYVDMTMSVSREDLPPGVSLNVTLRKFHIQSDHLSNQGNDSASTENGYRRVDGMLSATRCSNRYAHCLTAAIAVAQVYRMGRPLIAACMALGALVGGGLGLLGLLTYFRGGTMEQQLRKAIRNDRLHMVYQPVVDLKSGRVVGAEALARWTDDHGSRVDTNVFIRLAEDKGFVGEITQLALRHVLRDLGALMREVPGFQVSVNVTAWDLARPGFVPMVESSLAQAGVSSQSITIEITEDSTARHERAIEGIRQLRTAGHQVHIDDFGTGYSSLAYLQELSVDAIKIDKVFTQSIGTGSVTMGILPQIVAMADALNLELVVEGIETEEQARYFLPSDTRIRAQGWLFGRPMPANVFLQKLADGGGTYDLPGEICTAS